MVDVPNPVLGILLEASRLGDRELTKGDFADDSERFFRPLPSHTCPMTSIDPTDIVSDDVIGQCDPDKPFNVEFHHVFGEGAEIAAEYAANGATINGRETQNRYQPSARVDDGKATYVPPWADTKYFLEPRYVD